MLREWKVTDFKKIITDDKSDKDLYPNYTKDSENSMKQCFSIQRVQDLNKEDMTSLVGDVDMWKLCTGGGQWYMKICVSLQLYWESETTLKQIKSKTKRYGWLNK